MPHHQPQILVAFREMIAAAEEAGWDQENPEILNRARAAYATIAGSGASMPSATCIFDEWQRFRRDTGEKSAVGIAGERRQDGPVDQPLHLVDGALDLARSGGGEAHEQGHQDARQALDQRVGIRITVGHGVTSVDIDLSKLPGVAALRKAEG